MKREKTKKNFTISVNRKIFYIMDRKFTNKSKYIEWLIYQDLMKNEEFVKELEKMIL